MIERYGSVFIKPIFRGGIGKKGKSGLIGHAKDLKSALAEKERLYFAAYKVGDVTYKSRGVTFEGAVPAQYEIYFSITDSTRYRAPVMTLTHHGGMEVEELDKTQIIEVPFDPLTGLKSFVISNALSDLGAPREIVSPLVQNLPKLGVVPSLRYVHAGTQPHPHDGSQLRFPNAGGLRLQVWL